MGSGAGIAFLYRTKSNGSHGARMIEHRFGDVTLQLTVGDIAGQDDVDAIVNAANAELQMGGGVAGAIHRAAGPGLAQECAPLAPIRPGECVITRGFGLPNAHVIHCLGPVYGADEPAAVLLSSCYRRALELADENRLDSVAFPAISTGAFGYPAPDAANVALRTISELAPQLTSVKVVRMVLYSSSDLRLHEETLGELDTQ
jgi:O-acetyl-ADP-ribose deacetylase (regulator of RNase III)